MLRNPISHRVSAWLGRLRFPQLALLLLALLCVDLVVPDPLPFLDEILLAAASVVLTRWQRRNDEPA